MLRFRPGSRPVLSVERSSVSLVGSGQWTSGSGTGAVSPVYCPLPPAHSVHGALEFVARLPVFTLHIGQLAPCLRFVLPRAQHVIEAKEHRVLLELGQLHDPGAPRKDHVAVILDARAGG